MIWTVSPFFTSLLDRIFLKVSLVWTQAIGMVLLIFCAALVGLNNVIKDGNASTNPVDKPHDLISSWYPAGFAFITASSFSFSSVWAKHCGMELQINGFHLALGN
jgi:drug/metabolite transporter (DMT)-like permease